MFVVRLEMMERMGLLIWEYDDGVELRGRREVNFLIEFCKLGYSGVIG